MDYSNYTREQLLEYIQKLEEQNRSLIEKNESHSNNDVSKDQLISTIENTPNVAIKWFDEDGLVIYWNKASENLYGYTAKETIGKRLSETIHTLEDEVIFNKMLEIIKETGKAYGPYEALIHRRDGSIGWVLATTYPLPINNSKYIFACMYVDITEQKQVQSKLQKNEQNLSQSHKLSKMVSGT
jgi:PAS domain S-box-containing protein